MSHKKRFKSFVDGKPYVLISTAGDHLLRTATDIVNEKFEQIKTSAPQSSREDIAVLLSLQVVIEQILREDKLSKLKAAHDELEENNARLLNEVANLTKQLERIEPMLQLKTTEVISDADYDVLRAQQRSNEYAKQQIIADKDED
ncbi:MAG: cell division protein ZapA [Streptococcaceae bacterium]|nr:cell division protein ZapA [Streptococcaceae bacterium]